MLLLSLALFAGVLCCFFVLLVGAIERTAEWYLAFFMLLFVWMSAGNLAVFLR